MSDDGGPAFPELRANWDSNSQVAFYYTDGGMTLRDYFAATAMNKLLTNYAVRDFFSNIANDAYAMADAMLKARGER